MLKIGTAAYQNATTMQTTDNRLLRPASPAPGYFSQPTIPAATTSESKTGVTVSLSPQVEEAHLRASLGLNPTGRLTRQAFEAQVDSDHQAVRQALQASFDKVAGAGGDLGQITITQDDKGVIAVAGDWPGKEALAQELNADPEFGTIFTRLAANSKLLSYAGHATDGGQGATLSDYLDNDSADNNLTSLLHQYDSLKNPKNSLASLLNLSMSEGDPFSLTFENRPTPSN